MKQNCFEKHRWFICYFLVVLVCYCATGCGANGHGYIDTTHDDTLDTVDAHGSDTAVVLPIELPEPFYTITVEGGYEFPSYDVPEKGKYTYPVVKNSYYETVMGKSVFNGESVDYPPERVCAALHNKLENILAAAGADISKGSFQSIDKDGKYNYGFVSDGMKISTSYFGFSVAGAEYLLNAEKLARLDVGSIADEYKNSKLGKLSMEFLSVEDGELYEHYGLYQRTMTAPVHTLFIYDGENSTTGGAFERSFRSVAIVLEEMGREGRQISVLNNDFSLLEQVGTVTSVGIDDLIDKINSMQSVRSISEQDILYVSVVYDSYPWSDKTLYPIYSIVVDTGAAVDSETGKKELYCVSVSAEEFEE